MKVMLGVTKTTFLLVKICHVFVSQGVTKDYLAKSLSGFEMYQSKENDVVNKVFVTFLTMLVISR